MKRKIVSVLLCVGMITSLLAGCGDSQKKTAEEPKKSETQKEETAKESSELNEYGLTEEQQAALLASVKDSVTEGYLEKYNIPAADFKLLPFDVNDLKNYDEAGQYTGTDPYECASVWTVVNNTILWSEPGAMLITLVQVGDKETGVDALMDMADLTWKDTLEEQNQKNQEGGVSYAFDDTSSEIYGLESAVYAGIAKFLNQLDERERAEVLYELYTISHNNSENVLVGNREISSTTMFDKVISENIKFE